jgi:hypothetical protein
MKIINYFLILSVLMTLSCNESLNNASSLKTESKVAKKEAKQLEKDGWYVAPGALPLEKQLEKSYLKRLEEDEDGYPRFVVSTGNSLAQTQSAAKLQAMELAKLEIAGVLSSQIAATIDNQIANNQLNTKEAATLKKTVAASKNIIATKLVKLIPLVEIYRKGKKSSVESQVTVAFSTELARQVALESMKESLQDDADIATKKLESIIGF